MGGITVFARPAARAIPRIGGTKPHDRLGFVAQRFRCDSRTPRNRGWYLLELMRQGHKSAQAFARLSYVVSSPEQLHLD
jgi:hypothetical protein